MRCRAGSPGGDRALRTHRSPPSDRTGLALRSMKLAGEAVGKDFLIPVIDRVSFGVEAGEFVCLLGPNGCGKTTLLRIVGGLEPATRGRVTLDGEPIVAGQPHQHKIGVVFQEDRLLPWLTLAQNVALVLKPLGLGAGERTAIARR